MGENAKNSDDVQGQRRPKPGAVIDKNGQC